MATSITQNQELTSWIGHVATVTRPAHVHLCDGSERERDELLDAMLRDGTLSRLDRAKCPGSYLHRSHPTDVARTEHLTFISTRDEDEAGPTNNWMSEAEANERVWPLFTGAMRGRTMFVVPYVMGPVGSAYSRIGVQITDSPYVVANLRIMTRMGRVALEQLGTKRDFVRGLHSLGDLDPARRFIVHFPATRTIWSIGSGYGGNALLSKKCHALRIASVQAQDEGWLAEHMMIIGLTSPRGFKRYVAAAFPSACGKTNLAMLVPTLPGWKVETIGDDICWMHVGGDGRLWAINPEAGLFGVAPGTSPKTNLNAMKALGHDVIYTNVARRSDGTPWWEGLEPPPADEVLEDWRGEPWRVGAASPAAHPNARFTVSLSNCPTASMANLMPAGVPISAILFGGRRSKVAPLVYESLSWRHGVYVGATMVSETTAAATGEVGVLRHDPMAMLPFCGYNICDYFKHWFAIGKRLTYPPKIFHVNWFRRGPGGKILWPGFGDNIRVLEWILRRVDNRAEARETPIGSVPTPEALDVSGLDLGRDQLDQLLVVDPAEWLAEDAFAYLSGLGGRLPKALMSEHRALVERLKSGRS